MIPHQARPISASPRSAPQIRFTCVLLLKGAPAVTQLSVLRLGGRFGQLTPRAQRVESTQLSEPEVVHCSAGWKNSRNAAWCHQQLQSRSGDRLHLAQCRVTPECNALFAGVKQKACSSKGELFLTEKTKLPVFAKIYTFPGKNAQEKKSHTGNSFNRSSSRWMEMATGSHFTKPVEEKTAALRTSASFCSSHTWSETLSVCRGSHSS